VLEGRYDYRLIDGNVDPDPLETARQVLSDGAPAVVGVTVMPGPQVAPAIEIASEIRRYRPDVPIVWGGYFPGLYPDAAINAPYVDYVVRGQGEQTLLDLLERLPDAGPPTPEQSARDTGAISSLAGITWRDGEGAHHNPDRPFHPPDSLPPLPYERLGDVGVYLRPSFLGSRTGVHQAAHGCRYRCTFCGVASVYGGHTRLQSPGGMLEAITTLRDRYGVNAMQFYDHNFFDREETSVPMLDAMGRAPLPFWCYARADTLAGFSAQTWRLAEQAGLRMAYIGAEAASDSILKTMRKGTKVDHTLEVARRCREHGVIPEFSFILGGPDDPEGETEKTLAFIRQLKRLHPECEVILYFYTPTPQTLRPAPGSAPASSGKSTRYGDAEVALPTTPEEWAEPRWVDFVCHRDAPWLTDRMRERVRGFARVLGCRFPTAQDYRTPAWGKTVLRNLARWRYATGRYENPWELDLARMWIPLREPQSESL
jgi:radical SAM superfamily enzyme YgiQ (UPF0313 family)